MSYINEYKIRSLEEFFLVVKEVMKLGEIDNNIPSLSPLWFRGHEYSYYNLFPSLFRGTELDIDIKSNYSKYHLLEDYRYQIFKARGYDHVNTSPESRIEWQELMQHHFTQTRLMDWSESAITSLVFALQPFLDPKDDEALRYKRKHCSPSIWILRPYLLNKKVYDIFANFDDGHSYIERVLLGLLGRKDEELLEEERKDVKHQVTKVVRELSHNKCKYFSDYCGDNKSTLGGIVGLSVIESYRQANGYRIKEMIRNNEYNPFFYLLSRYYTDGVPIPMKITKQLPPLATIHPYHSNRIKAQRGAFTVFPYYGLGVDIEENKSIEIRKDAGGDIRFMENQEYIRDCLFKIDILEPEKTARQLLTIGVRRSSVYPELQNYSEDIESKNYHV